MHKKLHNATFGVSHVWLKIFPCGNFKGPKFCAWYRAILLKINFTSLLRLPLKIYCVKLMWSMACNKNRAEWIDFYHLFPCCVCLCIFYVFFAQKEASASSAWGVRYLCESDHNLSSLTSLSFRLYSYFQFNSNYDFQRFINEMKFVMKRKFVDALGDVKFDKCV